LIAGSSFISFLIEFLISFSILDFYGIWNLWFPLVQFQSSRLEEANPPLVTNGYPLSGGNSNKKKKAYSPLS